MTFQRRDVPLFTVIKVDLKLMRLVSTVSRSFILAPVLAAGAPESSVMKGGLGTEPTIRRGERVHNPSLIADRYATTMPTLVSSHKHSVSGTLRVTISERHIITSMNCHAETTVYPFSLAALPQARFSRRAVIGLEPRGGGGCALPPIPCGRAGPGGSVPARRSCRGQAAVQKPEHRPREPHGVPAWV